MSLLRLGFPGGSAVKESACKAGDLGSIPGLGRPPGEGKGYPLQYSGLENSMDCVIHGVAKSRTRLSDSHFTFTLVILPSGTIIIINQFKYSFISPKEISLASDHCSWP